MAEELRKFGIDIDHDITMKSDEDALDSLLNDAKKWKEEKRAKVRGRDGSELANTFKSWYITF